MNIAIFGTGYVGLVTGTCFAEMGNQVTCVDIDKEKIKKLRKNIIPIYEPYLNDLIARNIRENRLFFTADSKKGIKENDIIFNCVGTPQGKDNLPDLKATLEVTKTFGKHINNHKLFVNKSTVPTGTGSVCKKLIKEELKKRRRNIKFDIVSNPEFLRQGTAIKDFMTPERIVVGVESKKAREMMETLYYPIVRTGKPIIFTDIISAEIIKYAANSFIATKIALINDIALFCEKAGGNVRHISKAVGLDSRIGSRYLHAGIGYGGSCLPKDVNALIALGDKHDHDFSILKEVTKKNQNQRQLLINKLKEKMPLKGKTIAIWGLTFKPKTDDLRESPSVDIIKELIKEEAFIQAFDPTAINNFRKVIPETKHVLYGNHSLDVVKNADALMVLTEWDEFRGVDLKHIKSLMKGKYLLDGRNIYNPENVAKAGLTYFGIGINP